MQTNAGCITTEDGVRLYYESSGTGPKTTVVLNGFYLASTFKKLSAESTLICLDLRNRGRSDYVTDPSRLQRGIFQDVDDVETVRRHLGRSRIDIVGHSYAAIIPILYALKYPDSAGRMVQIGAMPPDPAVQYPANLTCVDGVLREFISNAAHLDKSRASLKPEEFCRKFWSLLRVIYVADPANAAKIDWDRCDLPTELNFMSYWVQSILPSIQSIKLEADDFADIKTPVLVIHGKKDRSSPYGGGRDWALRLPDARLITVENASHAPWIEVPAVLDWIRVFLDGTWPDAALRLIPE